MLDGFTVLDLSQVGPGPRCTWLLADLGATVVKVLPPAKAKRLEPPAFAYGAGRGTKRIRVDLKAPAGRDAYLRLVEGADAVVESYRPGVADRLGIGYKACREANAGIVYAAVTGYGQDGPYAQYAGHDLNYLAVGGFLACQGTRADGTPALPGATVADSAAGGMHAALSVCAALLRRERTGEGAYLDVSTTEGVLYLMALQIDQYLATGEEARPGTTLLTGRYACYDVYPARDGRFIAVGAIEPQFFTNLCEALGCPELAGHQHDDERQDEIRAAFREAFARKDRDEWVAELAAKDTCVAPVLAVGEVPDDEHLRARGAFAEVEAPDGNFRQVAPVLAGAAKPSGTVRAPSGSDAEALLSGAGFTTEQIAELTGEGIVA